MYIRKRGADFPKGFILGGNANINVIGCDCRAVQNRCHAAGHDAIDAGFAF
jgi:hypothetical protein